MDPCSTTLAHLQPRDIYLLESFAVIQGNYQAADFWQDRADKLLYYRQQFGTKIATVTTTRNETCEQGGFLAADQAQFEYAWWATFLYGFEYFGWGEGKDYSASGSCNGHLPYRDRPDPIGVDQALDPIAVGHDLNLHVRTTTTGTIELDSDNHIGQFTPGFPPAPPSGQAVQVGPIDAAVVSAVDVIFAWSSVDDATEYELWINEKDNAADNTPNTILFEPTGPTYTHSLTEGKYYEWWVRGVNSLGEGPWSEKGTFTVQLPAAKPIADLPQGFALMPNYPNPFNPETQINYHLPEAGAVTLVVYNTLGQQIRVLEQSAQHAGTHQVSWDGRDDAGQHVAGGVYLYDLTSGTFRQMRRMLLLK